MKKRILKNICNSICLISVISAVSQTNVLNVVHIASNLGNSTTEISTRAEVKGYKYKVLNGRQWKRLWSYTYAKWIDPDWTLA